MAGFADMNDKEVVLSASRMTWVEFAGLLDHLATFLVRGDIPPEHRPACQEHAASLHAAAKSVLFAGRELPNVQARIMVEAKAYQEPKQEEQDPASDAA